MKISDNQYLYRLETQNEHGAVVEYQEIETVEPLRSVRDVHDEIDLENNKQIKRIEEIVFTGDSDEYWYNDDTHTTDTHFVAYMESLDLYCNPNNPYCETDKAVFEFGDVHIDENKNFFCTSVESNGINRIYISIDKSLLSYTVYSHETLKEYFKENPVTVWYVLHYPVEIPRLHAKGHVMTHEGSTTIDVQPQTMGKVTPIVKATVEDSAIEMDSVPTLTINNTEEGNQITDLVFEGVTIVNNAKADNVKGTKEVSHTRYDFAPFYDGQTTINNTVEGGYVSAKLYGDTMINIAKPYGETDLLTATEDGAIVDLLGENTDGVKLADGTLTEGRVYGDSYVNIHSKQQYTAYVSQTNSWTVTITQSENCVEAIVNDDLDFNDGLVLFGGTLNLSMIKPNTKYLVKFGELMVGNMVAWFNWKDGDGLNSMLEYNYELHTGMDYLIVTTSSSFTVSVQRPYIQIQSNGQQKGTRFKLKDIMIFEYVDGMENWDLSYFEGIGSTTNPTITFTTHPFIFGKGGKIQ